MPEFVPSVIRVGRVSDDLRDALYSHAACFLFFSRCEGFGYPIIEATRQGCPVVAWNHGTAPELLEDTLPMMRNLDSVEGANLITRFTCLASAERSELRHRLITQSLRFSKGDTASAFLAAVTQAIAHRTCKSPM